MKTIDTNVWDVEPLEQIMSRSPIGEGASNRIYRCLLSLRDSTHSSLGFVLRICKYNPQDFQEISRLVEALEKRDELKKGKVPVVPTYRRYDCPDRDGNIIPCVIATDLTRGGSWEAYAPGNLAMGFPSKPEKRKTVQTMPRIDNFQEVMEKAILCAQRTTALGYDLGNPDSLIFSANKEGPRVADVVVGDFKHARKRGRSPDWNWLVIRWAFESMSPFLGIEPKESEPFLRWRAHTAGLSLLPDFWDLGSP